MKDKKGEFEMNKLVKALLWAAAAIILFIGVNYLIDNVGFRQA